MKSLNNNNNTLRLGDPVPYQTGSGFIIKGCYDSKKSPKDFGGVWSQLTMTKSPLGFNGKYNSGCVSVEENNIPEVKEFFDSIEKFEQDALEKMTKKKHVFENYDLNPDMIDHDYLKLIFRSAIKGVYPVRSVMINLTKSTRVYDGTSDDYIELFPDQIKYGAEMVFPKLHYGELSFSQKDTSLSHKVTAIGEIIVYVRGVDEKPVVPIQKRKRDPYEELAITQKFKVEDLETMVEHQEESQEPVSDNNNSQ